MADESNSEDMRETTDTTEPLMDSTEEENELVEENAEVMGRLHEEIDNLNLVLDHLERKNVDIYSRIEKLLASFQQNGTDFDSNE